MRASEIYRLLESSPVAQVCFYFTQNILCNLKDTNIGELSKEIKTGKTPSKTNHKYYENSTYPWFKPEDIGSSIYLEKTENKIAKFAVEDRAATIFPPKTLLINAIGDIGRMSILKIEASSNQQITGILFKEDIMPEYILFYLLPRRKLFEDGSSATTLPILNQKKICAINIKVPDSSIQKEFVNYIFYCLDCFERKAIPERTDFKLDPKLFNLSKVLFSVHYKQRKLMGNLNNQIETILKLRQAILQDGIQGKLVPQDPNDEPASELLKKIKVEKEALIREKKIKKDKIVQHIAQEKIPHTLPKEWVWVRLIDLVSILGDGIHGTPNYSENGEYFFINGNNLNDGKIDIKPNTKRVSQEEYKKYQKRLTDKTIFVSINGTIGNVAFYNDEKIILGKSACYFNLLDGISKEYVKMVIKTKYFLDYALENATGTTINNVSLESMRLFLIPLPPVAEQKRIVDKVDQLLKLCDDLENEIKNGQKNSELLLNSALREAFEVTGLAAEPQ